MANKYGARRTFCDGMWFDSAKEADRWIQLKLLERAGEITELVRQQRFELIPKNDRFRAVAYVADFVYVDTRTGHTVVEDVKGVRTEAYKLKAKMMYHRYGIEVKEV